MYRYLLGVVAACALLAANQAMAQTKTITVWFGKGFYKAEDDALLDVMESLASDGMTMVVVTHELRFAHHVASSVLMMDEGRIVEEAPPDEFFSAPKQDRTRRFLALVE